MLEEPQLIKKNKKFGIKKMFVIAFVFLIGAIGISYAFFNYYRLSDKQQELIAGEVYLNLVDGTDSISLTNVFPETAEEARARTDNVITFSIESVNTIVDQNIYYEILLNDGNNREDKIRFDHDDLVIDLVEVIDGKETLVVDAMSFSDFNERRIWVNTINSNTTSKKTITYKLRMWLSDKVIISDSSPNADYNTSEFEKSYANVKVSVYADFKEKNIPLSIEADKTMVENNQAYFIATVTNNTSNSNQNTRNVINDKMNLKITGTNSDIVFSYKDSLGNVSEETSETLDLTYNFNTKTSVEVQVFVIPKNDANASTNVNLVLTQNGKEIQNLVQKMDVYGNNFCLNNGFNKLYDCILASDSLATNVSTAISNIEAKGSPNLNQTAPTYTYVEDITEDVTNVYSATGYQFYFGDNYEFNPDTGTFKLYNSDGSSVITNNLSDTYKDYYTCGGTNSGYAACSIVYKIDTTSVSETTYTITKGDKITYKIASSIRSEVGLYKTEDDYGDLYFFRGDVTNNNVLFGGHYWKIIRTNGDNSIRLIYNGTTPNATGNATSINSKTYAYSAKYPLDSSLIGARYADPTYVGYMYGKNFERNVSAETSYSNIVALTKYYFGDDYEFDTTTETFKLKTKELEPISKTFSEMNETDTETGKKFYELFPYTCKSTLSTGSCEFIIEVKSIRSATSARVQYHSYSSVDKDSTRTNEMSSNAKTQLENWYSKNIIGKTDDNGNLITDYIVDGTFCNDRGITHSTNNSGYLLNQHTYYAPYTRLTATNVSTSLKCSDIRDKFSTTSSKGNALLTYPVALISADEVTLAGGINNAKNENYYLMTNGPYWTMSPSQFYSASASANIWCVLSNGTLNNGSIVSNSRGLRPVINISPNVLISQGDGTMENPYVLKLA